MIPIDKGIPIPRRRYGRRGPRPRVYPWAEMEVGDSFLITPGGEGSIASIKSGLGEAGRAYGHIYTSRVIEGGLRVWRIK
jgi:hypothetical protein